MATKLLHLSGPAEELARVVSDLHSNIEYEDYDVTVDAIEESALLEVSRSTVARLADLPRYLIEQGHVTLSKIVREELDRHRAALAGLPLPPTHGRKLTPK